MLGAWALPADSCGIVLCAFLFPNTGAGCIQHSMWESGRHNSAKPVRLSVIWMLEQADEMRSSPLAPASDLLLTFAPCKLCIGRCQGYTQGIPERPAHHLFSFSSNVPINARTCVNDSQMRDSRVYAIVARPSTSKGARLQQSPHAIDQLKHCSQCISECGQHKANRLYLPPKAALKTTTRYGPYRVHEGTLSLCPLASWRPAAHHKDS